MIDEKKITEAANAYIGYPHEVDEGTSVSLQRKAFRAGAEWAKENIIKELWRDPLVKFPQDNSPIVVLYEEQSYIIDILKVYNWETVKKYAIKWCYLSDLLPKGGEK